MNNLPKVPTILGEDFAKVDVNDSTLLFEVAKSNNIAILITGPLGGDEHETMIRWYHSDGRIEVFMRWTDTGRIEMLHSSHVVR
jgi:hypothetical protein